MERMWYDFDSELTSQIARLWTETSPSSRLKDINNMLNSFSWNEVDNLKDLIKKREYKKFQKEIWLKSKKDLDWKLWKWTFEALENYLKTLEIENSRQDVGQQLDNIKFSLTKPEVTNQNNTVSQVNWSRTQNWINEDLTQNGDTLLSFGNNKQSIEQWIFHKWPRLWIIWNKLKFDFNSKIDFVKPHLDDLSQLSSQTLSKIWQAVNYICISDKTITNWSTNKDLLWVAPRGYTGKKDWSYVWGCFRNWIVYAWRSKALNWRYYNYKEECSSRLNATDSIILHEIWHAFDGKYSLSTTPMFKSFHRKFYNRLWSYFQQWWPWWTAWCSEFFAEATAEFHKWWKEGFTRYYDQDFYNYMREILS